MSSAAPLAKSEPSDAVLLRAIAEGKDESALKTLHQRYAGVILAMTSKILRNPAQAEELMQEIFLEAWARASQYDSERASVKAWLFTLARSRAIDLLRKKRRRPPSDREDWEDDSLHAPSQAQPDVLAEQLERHNAVKRAVEDLSKEQREVMELCYFSGLSQRDVADSTGIPLGTVKSRIMSAMKLLKVALVRAESSAGEGGTR